jgi:hypothetical protein
VVILEKKERDRLCLGFGKSSGKKSAQCWSRNSSRWLEAGGAVVLGAQG